MSSLQENHPLVKSFPVQLVLQQEKNNPAKICAVEGGQVMWLRQPDGFQAVNKTSSVPEYSEASAHPTPPGILQT